MSRYFMYRGYLLPHLKFHLLVGRMLRSGFGTFYKACKKRLSEKCARDLYGKML
jgi:hypothetical protein